uniref:Domain of unknown function with conserved HDNR motif domain-containing protein n=1 Tax=Ciona savignyi TaxID=51511 RepID=H2ZKM1_CIOSA
MTKGRKHVPSQKEHGVWFPHRGMPLKMESRSSGTTTGVMLNVEENATDNSSHVKIPPLFLQRISNVSKSNSFSNHDNRNSFQDHGVYFGQGLGKQKIANEQSQHGSEDVVTWNKGNDPEAIEGINSIYREDFCGTRTSSQTKHRRYSKHYAEPTTGLVKVSSNTTQWVKDGEKIDQTYLQTLANTQEPHHEHNPWKYSYHA